jgi:hypothetical protein
MSKKPSNRKEQHIVVEVPIGCDNSVIEAEIHKALATRPESVIKEKKTRALVMIVQEEGNGDDGS